DGGAFARARDGVLGALRRAGVDARTLRRASGRRIELVAGLLERTDETLRARGLFDDRAIGWAAAEAIVRYRAAELPSSVVVEGLFHDDPSQWVWVEALARRAEVTVRLPRGAPDAVLSALEGRWHALERAPELELYELARPADVALVEARTDDAEARAIARAASSAIR